jgi:oxygen-independent coproporphyrinogen-3 oxidase
MEPDLPADSLNGAGVAAEAGRGSVAMEARLAGDPAFPGLAAREAARCGLYVHVPFCAQRCHYCDFSTGSISAAKLARYLDAIEREIALRAPDAAGLRFTSVFFGGGTPSAIAPRAFRRLWSALARHFDVAPDAEITLEANPESVKDGLLEAWAEAGVNRLSMGAQSFDPRELVRLGRIHDADRPATAFALARRHGFERLSLDLMFGFPGSSLERLESTVETALALGPEHLSTYCFIPEQGTPLGDAVARGMAALPEHEEQAAGYALITDRLAEAGYGCYETSNFARPDAEARHNLVYWLRRPYLGLGPSAHGLIGGKRYGNHYALETWARALERGERPEAERAAEHDASVAQEIMMLALRLGHGLEERDHDAASWLALERRYRRALDAALAGGRLERTPWGVRIAPQHRFIADDVIAWIEARAAPRV